MITVAILVVAGLLLLLAEIFLPGAIAGVAGLICLGAGVTMAFSHGVAAGVYVLLAVLVVGSVGFLLWLKYFPRTRLASRMFLNKDARDWHGYEDKTRELVGKSGVAASLLRPAGVAMVEGKRLDVITQGEMIDKGERIKIVEVQGNRTVVARDDSPALPPSPAAS